MTGIISNANDAAGRKRAGVRRMFKHHLRIDMTPMVDLGFLLISFFVITTELTKPVAMDLYMPKDGPNMPLAQSNALTVLLDGDKMFCYEGEWQEALVDGDIKRTNLSGNAGIRKQIQEKQLRLDITAKEKEGRSGLMVLIKASDNTSYKQVVDMLDEMTISMVKKYALVNMDEAEIAWLKNK